MTSHCIYLFPIVLLAAAFSTYANNLALSSPALTGQNSTSEYTFVQFNLSWDNSWRDEENWDAAWVFVKYKETGGNWNHASLNTSAGNHIIPAGYTCTVGETGNNGMGIFIYRNAVGSGNNNLANVQLRWEYGDNSVADDATVTVKVFAVEMVFVPTGIYAAGSGGSEVNCFTLTTINTGNATTAPAGNNGFFSSAEGGYPTGETAPDNASWPNGYNAFYCMKYEISQGQWVDFLNTLPRSQQNTRTETNISTDAISNIYVMTNTENEIYRNNVICPNSGNGTVNPVIFSSTCPDRACNYISWMDGCAYLDWAGLRPMSELEFEKACRGTLPPVANEFAWGNTNIATTPYTLSNDGQPNATVNNAAAAPTGNASYSPTVDFDIDGPLRCGIFATGSSTRAEAGASYYGIMELSGNLWDKRVTIANAAGRQFYGTHGDGILSINGNATNSDWPGYSGGEVIHATGGGFRGGAWGDFSNALRVSDRIIADDTATRRYLSYGFRGGRSGP